MRSGKSSGRKKPTGGDSYVHRPLPFGNDPPFPAPAVHRYSESAHSTLPNASYGGSVFSGMTGMLPMGLSPGGAGYGYGHWELWPVEQVEEDLILVIQDGRDFCL